MRKIGLIGGMSWASTELCYRHLNKGVQKRLGTACSAPILMESLNYCELPRITTLERWAHAKEVLIAAGAAAEAAGATALMIAANSDAQGRRRCRRGDLDPAASHRRRNRREDEGRRDQGGGGDRHAQCDDRTLGSASGSSATG